MTAETFSLAPQGIITNLVMSHHCMYGGGINSYRIFFGGSRYRCCFHGGQWAPKCTATLPLYITSESTVSRANFSAFLLPTLILWNSHFWVFMLQYLRSFHWCINYQCRTDIDEAKMISALRHKSKFEFQTFLKKIQIVGLPWCSIVLMKTFPLMYQLLM